MIPLLSPSLSFPCPPFTVLPCREAAPIDPAMVSVWVSEGALHKFFLRAGRSRVAKRFLCIFSKKNRLWLQIFAKRSYYTDAHITSK